MVSILPLVTVMLVNVFVRFVQYVFGKAGADLGLVTIIVTLIHVLGVFFLNLLVFGLGNAWLVGVAGIAVYAGVMQYLALKGLVGFLSDFEAFLFSSSVSTLFLIILAIFV